MDQEQLQQKIAEYYAKLSPEAQAVFSSMKWMETLESISTKYNFDDGRKSILGTETMLVLLGIIHHVEYEEVLGKELNIPRSQIDRIISEVDESILKSVRSSLTETFHKNNQPILTEAEQELANHKEPSVEDTTESEKDELSENLDFIISGGNTE